MIDKLTKYRRTPKGVTANMLARQRSSSKHRGHPEPDYSLEEFREWVLSHPNFASMYDTWVESDYDKYLKPSVDRLNDYEGYSFDNIQLVTWKANLKKSHANNSNGNNTKRSKTVLQFEKGVLVRTYHSTADAAIHLGCSQSAVSLACLGKRKTCKGYVLKYDVGGINYD